MKFPRRSILFGFPALLRSSPRLDEAFDVARASSKHGGLLVVRKGEVLFEKYFGRGHRDAAPNVASCGKSFTSVAVGKLVEERPYLFPAGLDQKIITVRHMPRELFPLNDPRKASIRLGQLLAMTAGIRGNTPGYVLGKETPVDPPGPDGWQASLDTAARDVDLWCSPGSGYSYATSGVHLLSMMIRRITGMELQAYIEDRIAKPLKWSAWGWGYRRPEVTHTPGGGGIEVSPHDMARFGELLLGEGRWGGQQILPAAFVKACGRLSPYNPHSPYSLQFDVNGDGQVEGVPKDAFWKTGSGGHCLYVAPSMQTVIWKLGGRDEQYGPGSYDGSREGWIRTVDERTAATQVLRLISAALHTI